jgi:hypothetical protein
MHDLSPELRELATDGAPAGVPDGTCAPAATLALALRLERRDVFSVRRELQVLLYGAVATVVAGVSLLVRANLDRIGPAALLGGLCVAAALCYAAALRAHVAARERSLGEDYVLLLGALLASTAIGYAEVRFRLLGDGWSRHLLLLAAWHGATAYALRSKLVLAVALTTFAGWLGVEARLGTVFDPVYARFGTGPRALLCALLFWCGARLHREEMPGERGDGSPGRFAGFRDVYLQFAANLAFWGALALGAEPGTRWAGLAVLLALGWETARLGLREQRQSFLLYAVGYTTAGLVWFEARLLGDVVLASWAGLATVACAVALLVNLRAKLTASAA